MQHINIAWFRQDLRILDNPMLAKAVSDGLPVLPVYIHAPAEAGRWPPGGASRWWLHHALDSLHRELANCGLPLVLCQGNSKDALLGINHFLQARGIAVRKVLSSRLHEPALARRDADVQHHLQTQGIGWQQDNAGWLVEPGQLLKQDGFPYRVFTPFWNALRQRPVQLPLHYDVALLRSPAHVPPSLSLQELDLLPRHRWDTGLAEHWDASPAGAHHALRQFLASAVEAYPQQRDQPAVAGTSSLSPYLHFGQLGPRQVWAAVHAAGADQQEGGWAFLRELGWREFAGHLLHHFPASDLQPLNARYADFPWQPNTILLQAWQRGETGYPLVDAGMRQLWQTGWMHNRVRMVVASFLVKHLLQPWQDGARWFWDTLVDADLANNSLGWQWVAGCGADAAPYFRIFNPVIQGEKFDPRGDYVRRWVPALERMPERYIHQPWKAPAAVLKEAKLELGKDYPLPVVEHRLARERALRALEVITR
jgi:deoxyribodipyrimidine photo-lyase